MHITDQIEQLGPRADGDDGFRPYYGHGTRRRLLDRILAAEGLEQYLGKKYPGTKRFGLEGAETFICCLAELIHRAGSNGVKGQLSVWRIEAVSTYWLICWAKTPVNYLMV